MKKCFIYHFFIIIILNHYAMAMQLRPMSKQLTRKNYAIPKTMVYTQPYTKLTLADTLKQYYRKFERWLWGPQLTNNQILKEADLIVQKVKTKTAGGAEDFDYFLEHHKQEEINVFLERLITTKEGLFLLNQYTFLLLSKIGQIRKVEALLKKLSTWAENNITQIFYTMPSLEENKFLLDNFFLLGLMVVPQQNIEETLIKNASNIVMAPNGRTFLELLKREIDPILYKKIIINNPTIAAQLKAIAQEQAEKLISRE
ncbi:MAG TPA: hypothetical protein VKU36_05400 [Candidatus Babeliales bacterium]|nr:hypothetical protein [Candidatus Babeliales bacterium]